jgi:NAD(P)H dehydrogenase (quinone)
VKTTEFKRRYLITAATGDTGSRTARELLAAGAHVRVLVHRTDARSEQLERLGAEVVVGDLLDFDSVRAALKDIQRAYFCFPIVPGLVQATAVRASGERVSSASPSPTSRYRSTISAC